MLFSAMLPKEELYGHSDKPQQVIAPRVRAIGDDVVDATEAEVDARLIHWRCDK